MHNLNVYFGFNYMWQCFIKISTELLVLDQLDTHIHIYTHTHTHTHTHIYIYMYVDI